jgi:hypothetical protein
MKKVAMCGMYFKDVVSYFFGALCGCPEVVLYFLYPGAVQLCRRRYVRRSGIKGDGAWGYRLPATGLPGLNGFAALPGYGAAGFTSGMGQLYAGEGVVLVDKIYDLL